MEENADLGINTTAILFGNIDKRGQLEADDQDMICLNKLANCQLEELNDTIKSLLPNPEDNQEIVTSSADVTADNLRSEDFYDEVEMIDETEFDNLVNSTKLDTSVDNNENYDEEDCMIVDDSSVKMPPPSELPSVFQNRRNNSDLIASLESHAGLTPQNENVNHLATPLGSILPPEFANIDIRSLFPHYDTEKIPRWSKLFKAFHEPHMYRQLDNWKANPPTDVQFANGHQKKPDDEEQYYYYNAFGMNMGEEAPANLILPNDADLISQPAQSFADCEVPVPYRDMQPCFDQINTDLHQLPNGQMHNSQNGIHHQSHTNNGNTQLIHQNNSQVSSNNNSTNSGALLVGGSSSYQRRMKMQQEAIAARKKRKRDDRFNRRNNDETDHVNRDELLIGLSWRDGPASYWYNMYDVPKDTNVLDYKFNTNLNIEDADILAPINIDISDPDTKFYSWQLFHWENDIIVDPTNCKKEVFDGNRKYAPYAGWIPSFKQRTVSSFQEVFCVDYFGICSSSATGTNLVRPTPDKWHSIFALENVEIMSPEWTSRIITDPRSPTAQLPYLLELDLNNEHIHFDFTNSRQTLEILTSELNDVFITSNNATSASAGGGNGTETNDIVSGEAATGDYGNMQTDPADPNAGTHNETPQKDEKQIKKLKILSKFSENATEPEDKPKPEKLDPAELETMRLMSYTTQEPYQLLHDGSSSDRSPFFLDIPPEVALQPSISSVTASSTGVSTDNNGGALQPSPANPATATIGAFGCTDSIDHLLVSSPLVAQGIQHSLPAVRLDPFLYPLKIDNHFLRFFHRPRLSDIKPAVNLLLEQPIPIFNLKELLRSEMEQREKISQLTGSGDLFFMRTINDLSATVDHLILTEYSEEYPPLLKQTGMSSRIINYYCGNPRQPVVMPAYKYGQLLRTPQIPFLGQLQTHQLFQALENNMFRAPIYPHKMRSTDFLVIMKPNSISIRRIDDVFTVGQQLPLVEVPAPNSKKANNFLKDFLQVQIIRLFLQSQTEPRKIRHDEIKTMFSEQSDSALKKRLKMYAEYKKAEVGNGSGYWILKPEFQLPTEDELLECISPEECCSYYSMMWGLCRLEDAGYNSRTLAQSDPDQQEDDEKDSSLKIEDEVKAAPWLTTKTFLDAQRGKCYLELNGATDPTGIGEGFSYARVSTKASLFKESLRTKVSGTGNQSISSQASLSTALGLTSTTTVSGVGASAANQSGSGAAGTLVPGVGKRMVTGTDADLRKLTLKKAHALLKECGVSEQEFKKLKRWDIIYLVREMSTQKAKQGEEEGMTKFARSSRLTLADQEERYRSECLRIFQLQNKVLSNQDELTSDEGASDDDEDGGAGNNDSFEILKLKKSLESGRRAAADQIPPPVPADPASAHHVPDPTDPLLTHAQSHSHSHSSFPQTQGQRHLYLASAETARSILKIKPKVAPKALCIRRYLDNPDGTRTMTPQTVPWSSIVKIYFKMNEEHKSDYLREFCGLNKSKEEEKKLRKKQQQEQLRRIKRQQKQKLQAAAAAHSSIGVGGSGVLFNPPGPSGTIGGNSAIDTANPIKKKYRSKMQQKQQQKMLKSSNAGGVGNEAGHQHAGGSSLAANISCGACGNKGHMRTNKECPLYGKQVKKPTSYKRPFRPSAKTIQQLLTSVKQNKLLAAAAAAAANAPNTASCGGDLTATTSANTDMMMAHSTSANSINNNAQAGLIATADGGDITAANFHLFHHHDETSQGASSTIGANLADTAAVNLSNSEMQTAMKIDPIAFPLEEDDPTDLKLVIPKTLISNFSSGGAGSSQDKSKNKNKKGQKSGNGTTGNGAAGPVAGAGSKTTQKQISASFLSVMKQNEYVVEQKIRGNRRRIDPKVALNHQFEEIYKGFLQVSGYRCFLHPVKKRDFPTYYDIIDHPMDLSTVKMRINENFYETRESFVQDIKLIYENCIKFNGESHEFSTVARQIISHVMEQFCAKERKLMRLERLVNPLMDEDDMVGMRFILDQTVDVMEEVEHSRPFHAPVDRKKYPDYGDRVARPMDLVTLRGHIKAGRYRSRDEFIGDANLIATNCAEYNGSQSVLTRVAERMVELAKEKFQENETTLVSLEANLVREDANSDSQVAESSCMTDHLSHMGEEPDFTAAVGDGVATEEAATAGEPDDLSPPPTKRPRLSEEDTGSEGAAGGPSGGGGEQTGGPPGSTGSGRSVVDDANRQRIMADLHLTDSEDDDDMELDQPLKHAIVIDLSDSEDEQLQPGPASIREEDDHDQIMEINVETQSPAVKFYIGDDD